MIGRDIGPYRILRLLGTGGMGKVFLARHAHIQRRVALKVLHETVTDAELVLRFRQEIHAAARVEHPGVVQVIDFLQETDGQTALVMEYLGGESLNDMLKRGPLPVPLALDVAHQLADILAAVHASGVVHRDVKPGNIMLVRDAAVVGGLRVKLLDFGLAKLKPGSFGDTRPAPFARPLETQPGQIVGTAGYIPPEQLITDAGAPREVDARGDVYALGATLFAMLAGRPPFMGPTWQDIILKTMRCEPPLLRSLMPWMPPEVCLLVQRMLSKVPAARPRADDVARCLVALRACLAPPPAPARLQAKAPISLSADDFLAFTDDEVRNCLRALDAPRWSWSAGCVLASLRALVQRLLLRGQRLGLRASQPSPPLLHDALRLDSCLSYPGEDARM